MSRLLLLLQRPYHLTPAESEEWLRRQAEELARLPAVRAIDMTRLSSVSLRFGREWDWLLEVHLEAEANPQHTVREPACAGLLADLRLLGMRPAVVVATHTTRVEGAR